MLTGTFWVRQTSVGKIILPLVELPSRSGQNTHLADLHTHRRNSWLCLVVTTPESQRSGPLGNGTTNTVCRIVPGKKKALHNGDYAFHINHFRISIVTLCTLFWIKLIYPLFMLLIQNTKKSNVWHAANLGRRWYTSHRTVDWTPTAVSGCLT